MNLSVPTLFIINIIVIFICILIEFNSTLSLPSVTKDFFHLKSRKIPSKFLLIDIFFFIFTNNFLIIISRRKAFFHKPLKHIFFGTEDITKMLRVFLAYSSTMKTKIHKAISAYSIYTYRTIIKNSQCFEHLRE